LYPAKPETAELENRLRGKVHVAGSGRDLFYSRSGLEQHFAAFLRRHWFCGRSRDIKSVQVRDAIALPVDSGRAHLLMLAIEYAEGDPEDYLLPVRLARGEEAREIQEKSLPQVITSVHLEGEHVDAILYAATRDADFSRGLLNAIARRRVFMGTEGELRAQSLLRARTSGANGWATLVPNFRDAEQSNTAVIFGDKYFLKLFRRLEPGENPDLEVSRFLTERNFPNVPPVAGWLEYQRNNGQKFTLGLLTRFLPECQDAWGYTLDMLSRYFERVRTAGEASRTQPLPQGRLLGLAQEPVPESAVGLIGTYLELARLLGKRTGELHLALAAEQSNPAFAPEPFTPFYQRGLFQSMRNFALQSLNSLRVNVQRVPENAHPLAQQVLARESEIIERLRAVCKSPLSAKRTRSHGDFHLGQVLYSGKDFYFIDFEGEPSRPLGERRLKRSPLRDVAGMLRSFDYITHMALARQLELGAIQEADLPQFERWTTFWYRWVGARYLNAYLEVASPAELFPAQQEQLAVLLDAHLLDKAVYEVGYELKNRPAWVRVPLAGILELLGQQQ
jgi:maltose alpha-D-glucosyltransferase/alpha-amylase